METQEDSNLFQQAVIEFLNSIPTKNAIDQYEKLIAPYIEEIDENLNFLEKVTEKYLEKLKTYSSNFIKFETNVSSFINKSIELNSYPKIVRQVWVNSPQTLIEFLSFSNAQEISAAVMHMSFSPKFYYSIGTGPEEVYFLYDQRDDETGPKKDTFLDFLYFTNGPEKIFSQDYHLSWPLLFHLYFPDKKIILTSDKCRIPEKYIYVLTFDYFSKFYKEEVHKGLPNIREDVIKDVQENKAIIVWNDCQESCDYSQTFKWWFNELSKQKLVGNSFIFSGDTSNSEKYLLASRESFINKLSGSRNKIADLNFHCIRYFEDVVMAIAKLKYPDYSFENRLNSLKASLDSAKHFLCFNRIVKDFRVVLSYLFYKNKLLDKSFVSQNAFKDSSDYRFGHNKQIILNRLIEPKSFDDFKASLPWIIDSDDFSTNHWNTIPLDIFEQSFIWITSETDFGSYKPNVKSFITEKTYKPIAFFMPFIMVGPPFTLQTLKEEGYQTFSKWWDESYDQETNPLKRMKKIESLLIEISKWDKKKLLSVTLEMKEVLNHNYQYLLNAKRSLPALENIMEKYER